MHIDPVPHAVHMVRVAAREGVHRGAVLRLDHEQAADRRLAVLIHERARGEDVDPVLARLVEVDPMGTEMLGARLDDARLVDSMDDEVHGRSLADCVSHSSRSTGAARGGRWPADAGSFVMLDLNATNDRPTTIGRTGRT